MEGKYKIIIAIISIIIIGGSVLLQIHRTGHKGEDNYMEEHLPKSISGSEWYHEFGRIMAQAGGYMGDTLAKYLPTILKIGIFSAVIGLAVKNLPPHGGQSGALYFNLIILLFIILILNVSINIFGSEYNEAIRDIDGKVIKQNMNDMWGWIYPGYGKGGIDFKSSTYLTYIIIIVVVSLILILKFNTGGIMSEHFVSPVTFNLWENSLGKEIAKKSWGRPVVWFIIAPAVISIANWWAWEDGETTTASSPVLLVSFMIALWILPQDMGPFADGKKGFRFYQTACLILFIYSTGFIYRQLNILNTGDDSGEKQCGGKNLKKSKCLTDIDASLKEVNIECLSGDIFCKEKHHILKGCKKDKDKKYAITIKNEQLVLDEDNQEGQMPNSEIDETCRKSIKDLLSKATKESNTV